MTNNNISSFMLTGSNALEDSMLKSILLFNSHKIKNNKKDLLPMAIFSIIIYGGGEYTIENILEILRERFALDYTTKDILPHISQLIAQKYIVPIENNKYKDCSSSGKDFFTNIESETEKLINGIIARITEIGHFDISGETPKVKKISEMHYQYIFNYMDTPFGD